MSRAREERSVGKDGGGGGDCKALTRILTNIQTPQITLRRGQQSHVTFVTFRISRDLSDLGSRNSHRRRSEQRKTASRHAPPPPPPPVLVVFAFFTGKKHGKTRKRKWLGRGRDDTIMIDD